MVDGGTLTHDLLDQIILSDDLDFSDIWRSQTNTSLTHYTSVWVFFLFVGYNYCFFEGSRGLNLQTQYSLRSQGCWVPKAGGNTFFSHFQPFFFISKVFQWIYVWNQEKTLKNIWKNCVLSYSLKLVNMQMLVNSLRGTTQFFSNFLKVFTWFQTEIHCKTFEIKKKVKILLFFVAAPKSWLKSTTQEDNWSKPRNQKNNYNS